MTLRSRIPLPLKARWHRWRLRRGLPAWHQGLEGVVCTPLQPDADGMSGSGGMWRQGQYVGASGLQRYGRQVVGPDQPPGPPGRHLPGRSFYLGPVMPHYGHCLTETFSRWWPLTPERLASYDWFVTPTPAHLIPPFAWELLDIAGVRDRVYCCNEATSLEVVSVAEPAVTLQERVHLAVQHLPALFSDPTAPTPDPRPLFVSRAQTGLDGLTRAVLGEEWIESALRDSGCHVIEPQHMGVREQIEAFRRHRRIVGFAGSAMHTVLLAGGGQQWLAYTDRNVPPHFHMLDQALGVRSRYLACGARSPTGTLDLQVSFRPQWIDPAVVLRACEQAGIIGSWRVCAYREQYSSGQLTRRFNALLLLRRAQELVTIPSTTERAQLHRWCADPMVDRQTLADGIRLSPELGEWLA